MKEGDMVRLKGVRDYEGQPCQVARLVDITEHSVKVIIEGIRGYFIFSKDCVAGVIEEEDLAGLIGGVNNETT